MNATESFMSKPIFSGRPIQARFSAHARVTQLTWNISKLENSAQSGRLVSLQAFGELDEVNECLSFEQGTRKLRTSSALSSQNDTRVPDPLWFADIRIWVGRPYRVWTKREAVEEFQSINTRITAAELCCASLRSDRLFLGLSAEQGGVVRHEWLVASWKVKISSPYNGFAGVSEWSGPFLCT